MSQLVTYSQTRELKCKIEMRNSYKNRIIRGVHLTQPENLCLCFPGHTIVLGYASEDAHGSEQDETDFGN